MLAYSSRNAPSLCSVCGVLVLWNQIKTVKIPPEKSNGFHSRYGFCSWEKKDGGRTALRPPLFVSANRLEEQRLNPKNCSGLACW